MLEKKKTFNVNSLSDRLIAKPSQQPTLAIRTNLDPISIAEENPYYSKQSSSDDKKKLDHFFENS